MRRVPGQAVAFADARGGRPGPSRDRARRHLVGLAGDRRAAGQNRPVRTALADDNAGIRVMLAAILAAEPDFEIVGEAENGPEAVALGERGDVDLLVLDLSMPGLDGLEVLERLRRSAPSVRVVVYTGVTHAGVEQKAQSLGARDVVVKGVPPAELVDRLRNATRG
jgi:two-component system response regulator DesR